MKCPACHHSDSKVTDSRLTNDGYAIRRRRECEHCTFRFSTYEEVEILNLTVIKRDGRRESYSREKMESGLKKALEKRPMTHETFRRLVTSIERDLQLKGKNEITSHAIGDVVMKWLKKFDSIAYIRFASVYRPFQDVDSFKAELNSLLKPRAKTRRAGSPAKPERKRARRAKSRA